jgi:hypothetical protein
MAGTILRERLIAGTHEARKFNKSLFPDAEGLAAPFDAVTPDTVQDRRLLTVFNLPLPYPNPTTGTNDIEMWVLFDPNGVPQFPSQLVRLNEGQIFHSNSQGNQGAHTIHWHGIEPTPANDGVGHDSFEIGSYTYQWLAAESGFYFYHCHKNTPLHFEMGLYGALIVDPPTGPGRVRANTPGIPGFDPATFTIPYDVERVWVVDEFDSRWHVLGTNDFMFASGSDPNDPASFAQPGGFLHDFRADLFVITGVPIPAGANGQPDGNVPITDPRVAATVQRGQTMLIRLLNGGYNIHEHTFGADVLAIESDGRPFGVPPFGSYSQPYIIPANQPFRLSTARRWSLILRPTTPGVIPYKVDFFDWITGVKTGTARTTITVL